MKSARKGEIWRYKITTIKEKLIKTLVSGEERMNRKRRNAIQ